MENNHLCNVCGSSINFIPFNGEDCTNPNITGTGYRENGLCPICKSRDRHRLLKLYLQKLFAKKDVNNILHFSPEMKRIKQFIKMNCLKYIGNYYEPDETRMWATDTTYNVEDLSEIPDNSFDLIILCHVLEHVTNFDQALKELTRICNLNEGGEILITMPINHTLEKSIMELPPPPY